MKNIFLFLTLIAISLQLSAQKIKIKKTQVFVDGEQFCLLEKSSANLQFTLVKQAVIRSLDGSQDWISFFPEEVMVFGVKEVKYKMTFKGLDKHTYVDVMIGDMKYYLKKLIQTGALTKNGLQAEGVDQFIAKYGFKEPKNLTPSYRNIDPSYTPPHNEPYRIVDRNPDGHIMLINGSIKQGARDIARYTESSFMDGGKIFVQVMISDMGGRHILKANFEKFNSTVARYRVSGDMQEYRVTIDEHGTNDMKIKSMVEALVARGVF
jgi:hypothetical protein